MSQRLKQIKGILSLPRRFNSTPKNLLNKNRLLKMRLFLISTRKMNKKKRRKKRKYFELKKVDSHPNQF